MKNIIKNDRDKYFLLSQFAREFHLSNSKQKELELPLKFELNFKLYTEEQSSKIFLHQRDRSFFYHTYLSLNQIASITALTNQTIRRTIKERQIPIISFGNTYNQKFISQSNFEKYLFNNFYISTKSLLKALGVYEGASQKQYSSTCRNAIKNIKKSKELQTLIGYTDLDYPIYFTDELQSQNIVFIKSRVEKFLNNHLTIDEYFLETGKKRSDYNFLSKKYKINHHSFLSDHKYSYISVEDYNTLLDHYQNLNRHQYSTRLQTEKNIPYHLQKSLVNKKTFLQKLDISLEAFEPILKEYSIVPIESIQFEKKTINYYRDEDLIYLLNKQTELYKKHKDKYQTLKQIKSRCSVNNLDSIIRQGAYSKKIEKILCPPILHRLFKGPAKVSLFKVSDVQKELNRYDEKISLQQTVIENPYEEFLFKTEKILKVEFNPSLSDTKELWYRFIKLELRKFNNENQSSYTSLLSNITRNLANYLDKNIYKYSNVSLNNLIFSEYSPFPVTHQKVIYKFIQIIQQDRVALKNFDCVNNPFKYGSKRNVDTSRYSYEEYMSLYNYASNVSLHKPKAIKDIRETLSGVDGSNYDSYWVYILIQLTNSWRHSTIISEVPEIELPSRVVGNLEWIEHNEITQIDADDIIFQLGRTLVNINKTGATSEFRIADPLRIPFATAIVICQIRKNLLSRIESGNQKKFGPLIHLNKYRVIQKKHTLHYKFFESYKSDFEFKNRKMNKTVMTLIWNMTRSLTAAQTSRSHFSEDSTMTYIKLSDKELEDLVLRLFERDSFGYLSKKLSEMIFNSKNISQEAETLRIKNLYETFGDVYKLEITSGIINQVATEQEDIHNYLESLNTKEVRSLYYNSLINTLNSKKKYYQCALSSCKFETENSISRDCANCHFSIINVYAISNLMELYLTKIYELINEFASSSIGEKKKMSNQFFLLWRQVQAAKERFGDAIYSLVDGGKERFASLSNNLPLTKEYLTINTQENSSKANKSEVKNELK